MLERKENEIKYLDMNLCITDIRMSWRHLINSQFHFVDSVEIFL